MPARVDALRYCSIRPIAADERNLTLLARTKDEQCHHKHQQDQRGCNPQNAITFQAPVSAAFVGIVGIFRQ